MTQELAAYGYLIAAICFIMALRGLSSPVTSRQGNLYGVVGMVIAIGVTIATPGVVSPWLIIGGLVIGAIWGALFGYVGHAATRGQRDFGSRRSFVAGRYDIIARGGHAEQARDMLRQAGLITEGAAPTT